jgi:hypothetical protein
VVSSVEYSLETAYPIDPEKIFIWSQDFLGAPTAIDLILCSWARERSVSFQNLEEILTFRITENSLDLEDVDITTHVILMVKNVYLFNDGPNDFINGKRLESFLCRKLTNRLSGVKRMHLLLCQT